MQKIQILPVKERKLKKIDKVLLAFALSLVLFALTFSGSIILNSFTEGDTVKTLDFTIGYNTTSACNSQGCSSFTQQNTSSNITVKISIFKTSSIISAFSNFSAKTNMTSSIYPSWGFGEWVFGSSDVCTSETGEVSSGTTSYFMDGNFNSSMRDGNNGAFTINNSFFANYTIDANRLNDTILLRHKYSICGTSRSVTISCYNSSNVWEAMNINTTVSGILDSNLAIPSSCIVQNNVSFRFIYFISNSGGGGGYRFYESAISYFSKLTNTSAILNNTHIWNYSGIFNHSNNRTLNFSTTFNNALNNGKCDCVGCTLEGYNCTLNLTIHSDTAGVLELSDLSINYTTEPVIELISPSNNSYSSTTKQFSCNATDIIGLSNITLYVWNSTGSVNNSLTNTVTNTFNSTTFNYTFNYTDTYKWNCLATNNESFPNFYDSNYTLNVDVSNPVITHNYPTNNSYLNYKTDIGFNCTVEGSNLDTLFFYNNFNGTYLLNQTKTPITSGVINNLQVNISNDGVYKWICGANKTNDATITLAQQGNFTLTIDTIYPTVNITSIQTTTGSQTIKFNFTSQDTNINSCKYSVFNSSGGIDGLNNNVSVTCGVNDTSVTVSSYATYNLTVYVSDLAGNENSSTKTFTVSQSTSSGGGGGGASRSQIPVVSLANISSTNNYTLLDREIIYASFYNTCTKKSSDGNSCSFNQLELSMIESDLKTKSVKITTSDLFKFYNIYLKKTLTQGFETQSIINQYGLISATLGSLIGLQITPPNIDSPFLINVPDGSAYTITRVLTSNKPLKSCDVIVADGNLNCTVTNTKIIIKYKLSSTDFTSKIFTSRINVVTDAPSDQTESKQVTLTFRVYNLGHEVFAGVSLLVVIIALGGLTLGGLGFFFYRMQNRKVFKLNKVFNITKK